MCHERSRGAFDCREATVLSRNGAHLFGVCCIIRTGDRGPHRSSSLFFFLSFSFSLFFSSPASWKTSFEKYIARLPVRSFEFGSATSPSSTRNVFPEVSGHPANETISTKSVSFLSLPSSFFFLSFFFESCYSSLARRVRILKESKLTNE